MKLPKIKLGFKLVVFFITLSSIPLFIVNIVWFNSAKDQVIRSRSDQVKQVANEGTRTIDSFINTKLISLIIHSQTESMFKADIGNITNEMKKFLTQDQEIAELYLLDKTGKELMHITKNREFSKGELIDQSENPAFRVTTFVGGDKYISAPHSDVSGNFFLDIAVPVVVPQKGQSIENLSTSASGGARAQGEIFGVLIEKIRLNNLWNTLNTFSIGKSGYIFIVDDKGNLLNHPSEKLMKAQSTQFNQFVSWSLGQEKQKVIESKNELGLESLTTRTSAQLGKWEVIGQVPLLDTLDDINRVRIFSAILFILFECIVVLASLWLTARIINPIQQLQRGAQIIGLGNFLHTLSIRTGDEIEDLSDSFNAMAQSLAVAFQKQEEAKNIISAERNKMEVTIAGIADSVIAVDLQRKIIIFNKTAEGLTGISKEKAIGQKISSLFKLYEGSKEVVEVEYCPVSSDTREGVVFDKKGLKLVVEGKELFVNLAAAQISEGISVNIGCILIIHDITKEKELERMRTEFVSMAAHELRTPLTSIRGYLSVFMNENAALFNDEQKLFLNRIKVSSDQLMALVENLLNISRIEKGTVTVNKEQTNWNSLVSSMVANFELRAREKSISLVFLRQEQFNPVVMVDKLRITEVLSNLLSNSIKYTREHGSITVGVYLHNNEVITYVKDNGIGIPQEDISKLFTKFYRVDGKFVQHEDGTGLGLYIAKAIVGLHGGKIWVESEIENGSIFSFSLPIEIPETKTV